MTTLIKLALVGFYLLGLYHFIMLMLIAFGIMPWKF